MRHDEQWLRDILLCAAMVGRYVDQVAESEFIGNTLLQDAVLFRFLIVGEASSKISKPLIGRHSEINWKIIKSFRNFIAHEYFALKMQMVYRTATVELPVLASKIRSLVVAEFPAGLFPP